MTLENDFQNSIKIKSSINIKKTRENSETF